MAKNLFQLKSLDRILADSHKTGEGHHTLARTLSASNLVLLGIGAIIGAGLFSITGLAAAKYAGPAVTISFIVAAVGCAFAGLCYAEFASKIPVAGSAYTYSYATMGEFVAWIIGWDLVLEYAVGAATVAISWSGYLLKLFESLGIPFPHEFALSPFETAVVNGVKIHGFVNLPAVIVVVVASLLLVKGTKESALVNAVIVTLKVAVVIFFIALGWQHINPANYTPYIPNNPNELGAFNSALPELGGFGHYGWSGILRAAAVIFFAYIGFDAVSTAAQEAKNPQRDMPIGILVSLAICTVLYILFAHVMTGLANYTEFLGHDGIAPVAIAIAKTPYETLKLAIIIAILAGYTSVILVMLMGQSRVFFSMSRDGLLPKIFSEVHPKFQTPWKSNLLFCLFVSLFAAFVPGHVVGEMTSIGTLFAFVLVCAGVLIIRKQEKDGKTKVTTGFRTPLVPLVPILGIVWCTGMMLTLPGDTWLRLIIWMGIGVLLYFVYSANRSVLTKEKNAQ